MVAAKDWRCNNCGQINGPSLDVCFVCETPRGAPKTVRSRPEKTTSKLPGRFYLTTAPYIDGYSSTPIDIVTSECVFGMNIFRDLFAGMRDFFGGRSTATQKVLRDARQTVLNELRREAERVGANAVIGVKLDYSEISGKGKSMLFLVASGTAVNLYRK